MALTLGQVQKQVQKLVMTPQMQQSIKLLQMNAMELEQLTEQEMLENPFLEMREERETSTEEPQSIEAMKEEEAEIPQPDSTPAEKTKEDESKDIEEEPETFEDVDVDWEDVYDYSENKVYYQREQYEQHDFTEYTAKRSTLTDHLMRQLSLSALDGKNFEIAEFIIGSLNDDGYLKVDLEEIASKMDAPVEDVEYVLEIVQEFDPPGVAARNLEECLRLQLEDQGVRGSFIYILIDDHLEDLQKKKFSEIAKDMDVDEEKVIKAFEQISRLEPKPGRIYDQDAPHYITPDVVVKNIDGKYMYFLNEGRSAYLSINPYYRRILGNNNLSKKEKSYALEKYRNALWLLKNIEKRKSTILRITEAIMNVQKDFLEKGVKHLKPLTLREIAEDVEMHESTVARVTTAKYVETPRGIFELKYFFSSGLETQSGENASSTSVKDMIARIIENEPETKPLSDQKIANQLKEKGIKIARRTVAKYRDQMRILPAKLRKTAKKSK